MKALITTITAGCILLSQHHSWARLGESRDEVEARYGSPVRTIQSAPDRVTGRLYDFNGFLITVMFLDGKSQLEEYAKKDKTKLTEDDVEKLLQANSGGRTWQRTDKPTSDVRTWQLINGDAGASLEPTKLSVATHEYAKIGLVQNLSGILDALSGKKPAKPNDGF